MLRNIDHLKNHLNPHNVLLRPHVKTAKCPQITDLILDTSPGPITVSTLKEAEQFAAAGYRDILYAVGIEPSKLPRVLSLRDNGIDLSILVDNIEAADAVVSASSEAGKKIPVLIEIDSDGHRAGVKPDDPLLIEIAKVLNETAMLRGVMTHAGSAYNHPGQHELMKMAEQERRAAVEAAERIKATGLPCDVVSVG
ncbi:MAG: DSD1 family PLP-dependent enzyme, partial [Gammaproteobacteria bacterium]|nr:DSD1 family PLP-dependent enzyme [Gammaproteobacteria bacterium]